ncbi:MAG: cardiolipin synthase [Eubacteriales bacterium]|nr:cardiolipin synthase [Eubacteriales bacterium]
MDSKNLKKAKKGLFRIIFSRTGLILLMILLQLGIFAVMTSWIQQYTIYINAAFTVLGVIVLIYIINSEGNPAFKMMWMLCVMAFPAVGTLFYIYVKTQVGTRWIGKRLENLKLEESPYMLQSEEVIEELRESKPATANLSYFLSSHLRFPTYRNTEVTYFPLGEDKFEALVRELKQAKHYIFMEYFIVAEGRVWDTVLRILKEKADEGVEVRFLYDGMNAISNFPYNYYKEIQKLGIKCKMSNPIIPFLSTTQNCRDHRKICVIDGRVAFTGGINLADEYINELERFGHWKDTAVMLEGEAVQSLTMLFLEMWNLDERDTGDYRKYLTPKKTPVRGELGYVLPYGDHPYDNENVGEEVYFHILNHAKKYVHIMTPYLILDSEMITTLTRAAKSGIEVVIIMPHIPDKWYAFAVAQTFYKELIQAGVQIYEYTPGFVHAKVFVSDDDTATVGTINLDYRSLYLHFECGVFIYNNPVVNSIEKDFQDTLKKCHKMSLAEVQNRSVTVKVVGQVLRLFAPLM